VASLVLVMLGALPAAALSAPPSGTPAPASDGPALASPDTPPRERAAAERAAGDRAFAERARQVDGAWQADPAAVTRAIDAYQAAVEAAPDDLVAWRGLLASLYFEGEHVADGVDGRREVFDRGKVVAEDALAHLARLAGADPESFRKLAPAERAERLRRAGVPAAPAAALYFWSGVHWGLWGDAFGRLAAARQGVAGTVRDDALTALALDPEVEDAGPHRVLGRLHSEAPKIPFFTGWIDRDRAISELETAVKEAPDEPLNRLYLAEALLDHRPGRKAEAVEQLRAILAQPPGPPQPVERASARAEARRLLAGASR